MGTLARQLRHRTRPTGVRARVQATANVTKSQTSTHCSLMDSPVWLRLEGDSDDPATWHPVKVVSAQGFRTDTSQFRRERRLSAWLASDVAL
jgi:hypothetical protein